VSEHIGEERLSASARTDERDAAERVALDQCNERVELTLAALQASARRVSSSLRMGMGLSHRDRSAGALARRARASTRPENRIGWQRSDNGTLR
jgi:hypothetical protein